MQHAQHQLSETQNVDFGVGCFILGVTDCGNINEWFGRVENTLSDIAAIKSLHIKPIGDEVFGGSVIIVDHMTGETHRFFQPRAGSIEFTVAIPERLQKKYYPLAVRDTRPVSTTEFEVSIRYQYHGPVAYVESLHAGRMENADGASGVVAVREYLEAEIRRIGDGVQLYTVGPSPFHCDFRVALHSEPKHEDVYPLTRKRRKTYDLVQLEIYENYTLSTGKAALYEHFADELSLYYSLVRDRQARQTESIRASEKLDDLIESYQRTGLTAALRRIFKMSREARDLILKVLRAEANETASRKHSEEAIEEVAKDRSRERLFLSEMQREIGLSYVNELHAVRESAGMLESSRIKEFEVAVIAASTLFGGIAGTIASILTR